MIDNIQQMTQLSGEQAELLAYYKRHYVDLASERVGGETLSCSDDFFAPMENLIKAGRGIFIEDKYTERGKWMDGWESRRSYGRSFRQQANTDHDWCVVRLGIAGFIKGIDVDTNYFRGNAPQEISLEACNSEQQPNEATKWTEIIKKVSVKSHSQNIFSVDSGQSWTHLRLKMYPDGGIARFRVYGEADVNWDGFVKGELIDLAAIKNGGKAMLVSDMFF
ncbi:MAG: hypothetical protein Q9M92_02390 [Enterobacterales bacterium]|nr:hypothetical protein [Enterobacterales bacterium]